MANKAAKGETLELLHAKTATVLMQALEVMDVAQKAYIASDGLTQAEDEETGLPALYAAPPFIAPALLAAITKFLKDNDITKAPEESEELSALAQALQEKRKKRVSLPDVKNVLELDEFRTG